MTIEQLRKALQPNTFTPFTIRLTDGQAFEIKHPEWVLIAPRAERTFVVADRDGTYSVIDLLLVTTLEFGKNGKSGGGRRSAA
jgi:hypothetical protein